MITVKFMKPFYTKITESKLRLVFAYQYFTIIKDDEVYHFIPIEGKEMLVNLNTMQVENLSEVFVFQRGNRFIRLPINQLLFHSNVHEYLKPILEEAGNEVEANNTFVPEGYEQPIEPEIVELIDALEELNIQRAIDAALEDRNETLFMQLTDKQENKS